jgi:hypothetical protein
LHFKSCAVATKVRSDRAALQGSYSNWQHRSNVCEINRLKRVVPAVFTVSSIIMSEATTGANNPIIEVEEVVKENNVNVAAAVAATTVQDISVVVTTVQDVNVTVVTTMTPAQDGEVSKENDGTIKPDVTNTTEQEADVVEIVAAKKENNVVVDSVATMVPEVVRVETIVQDETAAKETNGTVTPNVTMKPEQPNVGDSAPVVIPEMDNKPAAMPKKSDEDAASNNDSEDMDDAESVASEDDGKLPAVPTDGTTPPPRRGVKRKEMNEGQRMAIYYMLMSEFEDGILNLGAQSKIARVMSISRSNVNRIWLSMLKQRVDGKFPGPECVKSRSYMRRCKTKHSMEEVQERASQYIAAATATTTAAAAAATSEGGGTATSDVVSALTAGTKAQPLSLGTLSKALNIPKSTLCRYTKLEKNPLCLPCPNPAYKKPKARKKAQKPKKRVAKKKAATTKKTDVIASV